MVDPKSRAHAWWRAIGLTMLAGSCGGQQETAMADRDTPVQQSSESTPASSEGPRPVSSFDRAPRALPEETTPTRYLLSGHEVVRAAFVRALAHLVVAQQPSLIETVENPDGSYGGASGIYPAIGSDGSHWTLTETTSVDRAGVSTIYELALAP